MKAHRVWNKIVYDGDPFVSWLIEELTPSVYFQHCEVTPPNVFPAAWLLKMFSNFYGKMPNLTGWHLDPRISLKTARATFPSTLDTLLLE